MPEYTIDIGKVEELQMINDRDELERIFTRARSMVVQGGLVILCRIIAAKQEPFDEISTEEDLEKFKETVMRHVK